MTFISMSAHLTFPYNMQIIKVDSYEFSKNRCLLMKANDKLSYDKLLTMESHNGIRKEIPSLWNRNQKVIVERIRNEWKFNEFAEAEIHTICGVLEVNSFEVGQNNTRGRALYPTAFLLSHDCTPNTTHTDDPVTHKLTIRVTQPLRREGTISLSYSYTLQVRALTSAPT